MTQTALGHLSVVDATDGVAGQYCGKLLCDYGADTVLCEPPGGTPIRRIGPFSQRDGDSMLHRHLNLGKRAVDRGATPLAELCVAADIALLAPREDHSALRAANPRLITCTVSDFGEDGPRARWKGGELIHQALSGVMYRNGDGAREPLYGCGWRIHYVAGTAALSAVLAAVIARVRTGRGQHCQVDVAETAASMTYSATQYHYNGTIETRGAPVRLPTAVLKCADAWVVVFIYAYKWNDTCRALNLPDLAADPRFLTAEDRIANWGEAVEILQRGVAGMEADELVKRLQDLKCVAGTAIEPARLGQSEHLDARGYWETALTGHGPRRVLGAPFRMEKTPRRLRSAVTGSRT